MGLEQLSNKSTADPRNEFISYFLLYQDSLRDGFDSEARVFKETAEYFETILKEKGVDVVELLKQTIDSLQKEIDTREIGG